MKLVFCLTFFFFLCFTGFAKINTAVVCGTVKSAKAFLISVYEPVFGYYNYSFFDSTSNNSALQSQKSFYKKITIEKPSFVVLYFTNNGKDFLNSVSLLLFPGDSVHVNFDLDHPTDKKYSTSFSGSNSAGHSLYNRLINPPYAKFSPLDNYIRTNLSNILKAGQSGKEKIVRDINDYIRTFSVKFDSLSRLHKISAQYNSLIRLTFQAMLQHHVVDRLLHSELPASDNINYEVRRNAIVDSFFILVPPTDDKLIGLENIGSYKFSYYNYMAYKDYHFSSVDAVFRDTVLIENGKKYNIFRDFAVFLFIKDKKEREDTWASELLSMFSFSPGKYDSTIIDQFVNIFPNSKWEAILRKQLANTFGDGSITYTLQSPILFLSDSSKPNIFSDLKSVLKMMPGDKPVFIDMWASWCAPCIGAFAYNKQVDSFLISRNINRLYISIDETAQYDKWKLAVSKYSLGGYHIIAKESLRNDIKKICDLGPNSPLMIPRYLLVDKNGKVLHTNLEIPNNTETFFQQIINLVERNE